MLKLHYAPGTISIAVAIALEEAGVPYEPILVDFANAEQTKGDYHQINPKGRVPALETPQGILTETGAILEYAAPDLVPADAFEAAKMRERMYYLASTMHVNHAHKMRGHRWADKQSSFDDMAAKVPETVAASCAYLEGTMPDPGGSVTLADAYLYMLLSWVPGDGVDITNYPKLVAFQGWMNARPSIQAVRDKGML